MRVLITGGAGTLGSELVTRLLNDGRVDRIDVIDTFATSSRDRLPNDKRLQVHEGSVANRLFLEEVFEAANPSTVVHSAATYANPDDWEGDVHANVLGAVNLAQIAEEHGVERLVNFQTVLCYGRPDMVPISERDPLRPLGSYAITKVAAEQFLIQSRVPVVSLRIGSVLSQGLAIGPLPNFYRQVRNGETSRISEAVRDFLDPDDFFALLTKVLFTSRATGVFNVSTGRGHSIEEIFYLVCKHLGVDGHAEIVPISEDDVAAVVLDSAKAQEVFDWKPITPFTTSISNLLHWYDIHGVGATYSHHRG
jgi:UDP-glucose 4-epimerase